MRRANEQAFVVLAWLAGLLGCGSGEPTPTADTVPGVEAVVREQIARYPQLEVEDLYKLAHQATFGSGHAAPSIEEARRALAKEAQALREGEAGGSIQTSEPLIERLDSLGTVVRVNLRPYLAAEGDLEALLQAFLATARHERGSGLQLRRWWAELEGLAQRGQVPFTVDLLRSYFARQVAAGFPPGRHSTHYRQLYQPAYRVVAAEYLPPAARGDAPAARAGRS